MTGQHCGAKGFCGRERGLVGLVASSHGILVVRPLRSPARSRQLPQRTIHQPSKQNKLPRDTSDHAAGTAHPELRLVGMEGLAGPVSVPCTTEMVSPGFNRAGTEGTGQLCPIPRPLLLSQCASLSSYPWLLGLLSHQLKEEEKARAGVTGGPAS